MYCHFVQQVIKTARKAGNGVGIIVESVADSLLEMTVKTMSAVSCVFILAFVAAGSASAQTFNGFYVGAYAGGSSNTSVVQTSTVFSSTGYFASDSVTAINAAGNLNFGSHAIIGGGQIGYNFQYGHFVIGPELDFGSFRINATQSTTAGYPSFPPTTFTITQSIKTRGLFTARARFGFTFSHIFFYGTAGAGLTNYNSQEVFTDTFASATENGGTKVDKAGWVGGGGVEIALSNHWSMKGEFLYANFGTVTNTSTNLVTLPTTPWPQNLFTHSAALVEKMGRFGVNYRF